MSYRKYDVVVVGAGFAGSVMAERISTQLGKRVLVIDQRDHIGGTAYDRYDENGILVHEYGAHIFHTNSAHVVDYLSRFTEWRPFEHRVLARVRGRLVPIPINRRTLNALGVEVHSEAEAFAWFQAHREPVARAETSRDLVVGRAGRELYELLYEGYTRKQWALGPEKLHASVAGRLPVRTNCDDRYFTDPFQMMPSDGYTAMFERMLAGVDVQLGCSWWEIADEIDGRCEVVYTGLIDEFFGYALGRLPYRSVRFSKVNVPTPGYGLVQPVGVINEPDENVPYTRTIEFRHLTGQVADSSTIFYEYAFDGGDPHYPIPTRENWELLSRYRQLAEEERPDVTFVGRMGTYKYMSISQVVAQALNKFEHFAARERAAVG